MLPLAASFSLVPSASDFYNTYRRTTMNETAERFNGWAAMLGVVAALGAYASTGQIIPGIW